MDKFGFTELDVDGVGTIMVDAIIVYKGEAFLGDILKIEVGTGDFHKLGCDFFYKLINKETSKEIARAKTGLLFFDYEKRKMLPMPEKFKESCGS